LGVLDLELIDQATHDAIRVKTLAQQFPYSGAGLVELENAVGRNIDQDRGLIQALRYNLRVGTQCKLPFSVSAKSDVAWRRIQLRESDVAYGPIQSR